MPLGEHVPSVPLIETQRLTLRGHRLPDYAGSSAMWGDASVVRYISGTPSSAQQSWMRVLNYVGHWSLMGFGYWLVEETRSRKFVGEVGFADFHRELDPSLRGVPEIGWALATDMQGMGFANEAVRAVVDWSDRNRRWERTICLIDPRNSASIRLANRIGYARAVGIGGQTLVLVRAKPPDTTTAASPRAGR